MALPATAIQTGINMLQVGALRMPMLLASLNGALLVGEAALRVTTSTLQFFGFTGESDFVKSIRNSTPQIAVEVMRPHKNLTNKQLAISALACCIIGTLGTALIAWAFGAAPSVYNTVLTYLGPIRISNDLHPMFSVASRWLGH